MDYIKETLPNGLRAIYVPMKGTKTVSVLVLVGVGSRYETKKTNGISHFLEHMAFKGTQRRPTHLHIAQELDGVGAQYNAYTSKEYTGYWVKVDSRHAELAVDMVSDIFLNSTLPAKEIEKERGVILGEIDMYKDDPRAQAFYTFSALALGDQPSGWRTTGTKGVVSSLRRASFLNYRARHYRASNVVVVVAGNVTAARARKLVHQYLSPAQVGTAPKAKPATWGQRRPRFAQGSKKFDQTHLILGVRAPDYHDERWYALQLLRELLGGSMSSRLYVKVREELGLGYYVGATTSLYDDHGFFMAYAGVDPGRLNEAVRAVLGELSRVRTEEVGSAELAKAYEHMRGNMLINFEASDAVADYFAEEELLGKELLTPEEKFRMLKKVTPADVKKVAQEIFTDNKLNLAVVGPVKDAGALKKYLTFS